MVDDDDDVDGTTIQGDMVDIYEGHDNQLVQRVMELLRSAGVEPMLRDRSVTGFPTQATTDLIIAVVGDDAERSRSLIEAAVQDGVIGPEGDLLTP